MEGGRRGRKTNEGSGILPSFCAYKKLNTQLLGPDYLNLSESLRYVLFLSEPQRKRESEGTKSDNCARPKA